MRATAQPRVVLTGRVHNNAITLLRSDLDTAGFTVDALDAIWGPVAAAALKRGHRVPALQALEQQSSPLATLATLFVLGLPVSEQRADAAFPTLGLPGAEQLGLLLREQGSAGIHPLLDLRPYSFTDALGADSWWIASDLGELALGHAIPEGHVLGVGGASLTLSGLMIPTAVETVLDLGTGCGIQAMHASRHAKRVVATDISERALQLAAFNAELNGIDSIEFKLGSLFEPVEGELFDHIVSNPPFVITPRAEGVPAYEYRDGGLVGDAIVQAVIEGAARHLRPGGVAQLLGNWEYHDGQKGLDRVAAWVEGLALDTWVVEREVQDAALYAETWIRDGGTLPGTEEFDLLSAAWLDDFADRGVGSVGFGYVTLRATAAAAPLRRFERIDATGENPAGLGAHLAAALAGHDWQAALQDDALASMAVTVAADVTEERHYWPGDEHPTVIDLRQGSGFGRTVLAGTAIAAVVGACDGELSLGAICAAIAELLEVDEAEVLDEVLPSVRELMVTGFLLP